MQYFKRKLQVIQIKWQNMLFVIFPPEWHISFSPEAPVNRTTSFVSASNHRKNMIWKNKTVVWLNIVMVKVWLALGTKWLTISWQQAMKNGLVLLTDPATSTSSTSRGFGEVFYSSVSLNSSTLHCIWYLIVTNPCPHILLHLEISHMTEANFHFIVALRSQYA